MNIGIIGVGVIGSAIVEGFCLNEDTSHSFYLSPRGESMGKKLVESFSNVRQCTSNQEVLDKADVIIVSVLPSIGLELLKSLEFKSTHHVINLMRNIKLNEIEEVIGKTQSLTHMVPLSFISKRQGPIAIYPANDIVADLFCHLGSVKGYDTMAKIESVAAITGLMTSYYRLLNDVSKWGMANNLTRDESVDYTTDFYLALTQHAKEGNLEVLSSEATPGGINEYALKRLERQAFFSNHRDTLNPMLEDIKNT